MTAPARRVLVCDDEPQILRALRVVLRDAGFDVVPAATAREALDRAAVQPPDAAIIDLVLPDGDGIEVCRSLREWSRMPIIVLSAVGDEEEKVRALEAGADDYVVKPFAPRELVARLQATLRRAGEDPGEPAIVADGLEIDVAAHTVRRDGAEVHLTPIEFDLLRTLARQRGRLMTHRSLLVEVWGPAYADDTQVLRTHIANLRRKIEPPARRRATSGPTPASATASSADRPSSRDLDAARGDRHGSLTRPAVASDAVTVAGWTQLVLFVAILTAITPPLGAYLVRVFAGERVLLARVLGPVEHGSLRLFAVDRAPQDWKAYARSALVFSAVCLVAAYAVLRTQAIHPWDHGIQASLPWDVAFNTAVSFVSNTSWQFYAGETRSRRSPRWPRSRCTPGSPPPSGSRPGIAVIRGFAPRGGDGPRQLLGRPGPRAALRPAPARHARRAC